MANERFVEVYNQGLINVAKIIVDTETGVNYLMGSHSKVSGTGLTVWSIRTVNRSSHRSTDGTCLPGKPAVYHKGD